MDDAPLDAALVLSKCRFFAEVGVWPLRSRLNPQGWLDNFTEQERPHAIHMLDIFMYFNGYLVDAMFAGAVQNVSRHRHEGRTSATRERASWREFLSAVIVCPVRGEEPRETDSGILFARMARDSLGIPETNILDPEDSIRHLFTGSHREIIFVDDFVGSGNQFIETWYREASVANLCDYSFADLARDPGLTFYYCPLICTAMGFESIRRECPQVQLLPAHTLSARYNLLAPDCVLWPPALLPSARAMIEEASLRAGIPLADIGGFADQGLCLAFAHGTPDETLPLFTWETGTWKPLIRKG